ncbi:MAG: hypothetical protein KH330_09075 [Clostridiales bacterium]|nr:hypothetical protein [Clostridiales bacterium]
MEMQYAYSLCDCMEELEKIESETFGRAEYLYMGSYFCDLYFIGISQSMWEESFSFARRNKKTAVLVVPTPSQRNMEKLKEIICKLLRENGDVLKEVAVNDFGMLRFIDGLGLHLSVWCGRLMSRETRDPRYPEFVQSNKLSQRMADGTLCGVRVKGLELDTLGKETAEITDKTMVSLHIPYTYITMGRYCELGSIGLPPEKKFRLWDTCSRSCQRFWNVYRNDQADFLKYGRAVYAEGIQVPEGNIHRLIYNGIFDKIHNLEKEDSKAERRRRT